MQRIIIITEKYPFGTKENFIDPEIDFIKRKLLSQVNVDVVALTFIKKEEFEKKRERDFDGIQLIANRKKLSIFQKNIYLMKGIFRKDFWSEVIYLGKDNGLSLNHLKNLCSFVCYGEFRFKCLEKYYKDDLKTNPKEMVFYSYWMMHSSYAVARLSKKYGCKVFSRVHGYDLYPERNNGYLPMRRFIIENLNCVFSVSKAGRDYLRSCYGHKEKIKTSYLGSRNITGYKNVDMKNEFTIVTCAYLAKLKRIPRLAEVLSQIFDKCVRWVHFGNGPDESRLLHSIKNLPSNIKFEYRGEVNRDEILSFYKSFDVHLIINLSTTEGLPMSLIEAVSFGIPAIATNVGGTSEVVENKYNGLLLQKDFDNTDLEQAIRYFLNLPFSDYQRYRLNSFEKWKQCFDSEKNYEVFYNRICKKR